MDGLRRALAYIRNHLARMEAEVNPVPLDQMSDEEVAMELEWERRRAQKLARLLEET